MNTRNILHLSWLFVSVAVPWSQAQDSQPDPQGKPPTAHADTSRLFYRIPRGFGFEFQVGAFFKTRPEPTTFTDIPQNLRTVPTHPDDGYPPGTLWTIPTAGYSLDNPKLPSPSFFSFAPQFTLWRFSVRGGLKIRPQAKIDVAKPTAGSSVPEINQQGTSDRGAGESLVYYFLYWGPQASGQTKPFAEVEFRMHRLFSIIGGYDRYRSTTDVFLENGWDRYDAFQTHTTQTLASITQSSGLYGALRIAIGGPYVGFRVGFTSMATKLSYLYPGVDPNFPTAQSNNARGLFWAMDFRLTQSKLPETPRK